jgi:hypothetical protein
MGDHGGGRGTTGGGGRGAPAGSCVGGRFGNGIAREVCSGVPPSLNFEPSERLGSSDTLS